MRDNGRGDHQANPGADPLREINLRAWTTNRRRVDQLAEILAHLRSAGQVSPDKRNLATSLIHQLIGSAGTFGHDAVSEPARRIELLLGALPVLVPAGSDELAELDDLVRDVRDTLEQEPRHG